jgi:hypothetical protein
MAAAMANGASAESIGVTMYLCRDTGTLLCEAHHGWAHNPLLAGDVVCTHTPLLTLNGDGCRVCEAWAKVDRAVERQTARLLRDLRATAAPAEHLSISSDVTGNQQLDTGRT